MKIIADKRIVLESLYSLICTKMSESDSSTGTDSNDNMSTSDTEREKLSNMTEKELLVNLLLTLKRKKGKKKNSKSKSKKVENGKDISEKKLKELNNKRKEKKNEPKILADDISLPQNDWNKAVNSGTGTAMTKYLLGKLFSQDELREGNYGGGGERKALDNYRLEVIKGAVEQYYNMTQTQFSAAVNQKCQQVTRNKEFRSLNGKTQAKKTGEDKFMKKGRESIMVEKNSFMNQQVRLGPKKKIQAIKAGKDISREKKKGEKSNQVEDNVINSRWLRSHDVKKIKS